MKATLDIGIADLEKNMSDYVAEVSGNSGNQDAAKQNQHYQEAQAALDSLKAAKEQLTTTVEPALQWAIDGLNARDSGSGGADFPQTVERLLDNPACGQFFKAVEDVRKGAGGEDISSSEEAAFNSDAADALREENVGAGGLDKAGGFSVLPGRAWELWVPAYPLWSSDPVLMRKSRERATSTITRSGQGLPPPI